MKYGIKMIVCGFILTFVSMIVWMYDNDTFDLMGLVGICGMIVSWLGLIVWMVEKEISYNKE